MDAINIIEPQKIVVVVKYINIKGYSSINCPAKIGIIAAPKELDTQIAEPKIKRNLFFSLFSLSE